MTDKHDQARPDAQAEARAIVSAYFKGSSAYDDSALVKDIAAALAAKDAELAEAWQRCVDLAAKRRIDAEAQLAEANKALEAIERRTQPHPEDTPEDDRRDKYHANRIARRAREGAKQ